MKKLFAFCAGLLAVLNQTSVTALAAEPEAAGAAAQTPLWLCIPFAGLLLCIAVLPLVKAEWWEAHQPHAVVFWSLLFLIPFAVKYGVPKAAETTLECIINDYLTFIVLLFGLFCVSGNITLSGDLAGSPRINVGLLALGTLLSSWIGTTGASMLMIRPIIKMNAWRKRRRHIVIFFIQYGRLPDSDRRSASAHGIHAGCPVFLELKAFTDPDLQYDHPAVHLLSF